MQPALLEIDLPGFISKKGKVRNLFDLGDQLLLVASDRISAFDCILPTGIPDKGKILTQISLFWFDFIQDIIPNHLISSKISDFPAHIKEYAFLAGRSMLVKKTKVLPIECVVRGYLSGSGWKEYQKTQSVCGIKLPGGLKESAPLPEPIFTPTTKEETGHDMAIDFQGTVNRIGQEAANFIKAKSLAIYKKAAAYAQTKGIIIADTKFEFGVLDNQIILIDEVLTPDSSRFWPKESYAPGISPPSFDKQFVRDYLETLTWDKTPPAPPLPEEIVKQTREKYLEAYVELTGENIL